MVCREDWYHGCMVHPGAGVQTLEITVPKQVISLNLDLLLPSV